MNKMKHSFKPFHCLWYALVGAAVFFYAVYAFGLFTERNAVKIFEILSDALIIPGVLLAGVAAISWTGALGTYDMLGYGIKTLFFFLPQKEEKRYKTFYDYRQAKEEKGRHWLPEMLVVGLAFVLLGVISLVISLLV